MKLSGLRCAQPSDSILRPHFDRFVGTVRRVANGTEPRLVAAAEPSPIVVYSDLGLETGEVILQSETGDGSAANGEDGMEEALAHAAPAAKGSSVDLEMSQGETVDLSEEERALFAEVTLRQWTNLSHRLPKFFKPKVTSAQVCEL
jgi:hypothetical protein